MKTCSPTVLGSVGTAIGVGLLAGLAGTLAITLSQMAEMKMTGRKPSQTPVKAVNKVLDIKPSYKKSAEKVSNEIHWVYGTSQGITRGLISLTGLKGLPASLLHFATVWGASLIMLPKLKVAPAITEEKPQEILTDAFHHAVYAAAAGVAYDTIAGK
jgi:hypothetical protein